MALANDGSNLLNALANDNVEATVRVMRRNDWTHTTSIFRDRAQDVIIIPLAYVVRHRKQRVFQYFMRKDPSLVHARPFPHYPEMDSILHYACFCGNPLATRFLLVEMKWKRQETDSSPLQFCLNDSATRWVYCARILLEQGAVDPNQALAVVESGTTTSTSTSVLPLHTFCARPYCDKNDQECIRLLLKCGANVNKKDERGVTPLHVAAEKSSSDLLDLLLASAADPNIADEEHGWTPVLSTIIQTTNMTKIKKLLQTDGSNVNARDKNGQTALHLFWTGGCHLNANGGKQLVELLLQHGADINARDNQGRTPFLWACSQRRAFLERQHTVPLDAYKVIGVLLQKGADPFTKDYQGNTSLDYLTTPASSTECDEALALTGIFTFLRIAAPCLIQASRQN